MNYAAIYEADCANGVGCRTSFFVSGCTHHCKGCFNEEAQDFNYGKPYTREVEDYILATLEPPEVDGLSVLGGEPMEPANQEAILPLIRKAHEAGKTIWIYSGYLFEELMDEDNRRCRGPHTRELLELADILVDGEFIQEQKNISLRFRGSENQRILDLPRSLEAGAPVLWSEAGQQEAGEQPGPFSLRGGVPPEQEQEEDEKYKAFVEKFKPKKTTDDCYTPPAVYDAIAGWVAAEFHLDRGQFVRPFYPGGDFEAYPYKAGDVVVDNPPFSILKKIVDFYQDRGIPFFLFAPHLTLMSRSNWRECAVVCYADIVYENGARVRTSFLTNLDTEHCIRTEPGLTEAISRANKQREYKHTPKYIYPDNVVTAALLGPCVVRGLHVMIPNEEAEHFNNLDAQKAAGKKTFGCGFLVSDKWAGIIKQARPQKFADNETTVWELSDRERKIVRRLSES